MKSFLIGSLPFIEVDQAIKFIETFDIPTICTLPQLDESEFMLHHAFSNLKGFEWKRNRVHQTNLNDCTMPFNFQLETKFFENFKGEYKWQATGPVSMIETMEMHEWDDKLLEVYIEKIIGTQIKFNQQNPSKSYFFLDEPMLGTSIDLVDKLIGFIAKLKASAAFKNSIFGLHCCSKIEYNLSNIPVDLFALDYSLYTFDEWNVLQVKLTDKLVAIMSDSNGKKINYPVMSEKFKSTSCGQALADLPLNLKL